MNRRLTPAEENHLARLLGWVRCEIGMEPGEYVAMVQDMNAKLGKPSDDGKARLIEGYRQSESVPKYIRAAVKALDKALHGKAETVEAEPDRKELPDAK